MIESRHGTEEGKGWKYIHCLAVVCFVVVAESVHHIIHDISILLSELKIESTNIKKGKQEKENQRATPNVRTMAVQLTLN